MLLNFDINLSSRDDDSHSKDLMLAQTVSVKGWDNEEDEVWNHVHYST